MNITKSIYSSNHRENIELPDKRSSYDIKTFVKLLLVDIELFLFSKILDCPWSLVKAQIFSTRRAMKLQKKKKE